MKKKNRSLRLAGNALALAAGLSLWAPVPAVLSMNAQAEVQKPEDYEDEKWARLLDDTLEYEEIPDLIEFFNPVYRAAAEQVEDGLKDSYELARKMREDGKEYRQQAKGLEAEGDQIYSAQYKAMARSLDSAASAMEKTLDKQAKRLDRNTLAPVRYQLSSAVQSLMIGYQQMEVNKEMLEKMVELYTQMLSLSNTQSEIGMATSTDLLSAKVSLTSAENQLSTLETSMDSMRRTLIMLTGWDYTDNPAFGKVPDPDMTQIENIDREADKIQAIAYNQEIISLKNSKQEGRTIKDIHSKERSVSDAEETLRSNMDTLYYSLIEKQAALQAAETAFQQAQLTMDSNNRRYQLGMLGRAEYLGTEIAYYQAKAARETANMNMLQALNEYQWALKGVLPAE